jgi:hypothetical protein
VLHSQIGCRKEVDSRLLVVGVKLPIWLPALLLPITWAADVQMANASPFSISTLQDLSNDTKNASMRVVFEPFCRTLNIRESRRTPSPQLWECWASPPHLAKVGLRQRSNDYNATITITQNAIKTRVSNEMHHFICNLFSLNMMKVVENLEVDRNGCKWKQQMWYLKF